MSATEYTLADYYTEANIQPVPEWAGQVGLWNQDEGKPLKPMWNQVTGLSLAFQFDNLRSALFDDMGSGKTLPSQAFAIWNAWAGNKVVVLMPRVLLGQYLDSMRNTFQGIDKYVDAAVYYGDKRRRDTLVESWMGRGSPSIVLTTYNLFTKEYELFNTVFGYTVLVMDECRIIGSVGTKGYAAISRFMGRQGEKAALLMNGSPGKNNLSDLYGYIEFLTPGLYPSKDAFDRQHVEYTEILTTVRRPAGTSLVPRKIVSGFRNTDLLHLNLYKQARRIDKKDVMELPEKHLITARVHLSDKHASLYRKLVAEKLLMFEDSTVLDMTYSAAVRHVCMQVVTNPRLVQLQEESAVFEAVDGLLDQADLTKTKVFLLCHYQATVETLAKRYSEYRPAIVYGKSDSQKEKDRFLNDPACRIMVANYTSGGVGLNLQGVCHTAICVEPTTVPGDFEQAVDRLHRKGQKSKVTVYLIVAVGTIFVKTVSAMRKKQKETMEVVSKGKLQDELLGGDADEHIDDRVEPAVEAW